MDRDPAVPRIFYFKYHVGACLIIISIGNPDVDNMDDVILILS